MIFIENRLYIKVYPSYSKYIQDNPGFSKLIKER